MDVALVLLDPGLNEMASLPNVDLNALTGHTVHTRSLESQVILCTPKEARDLLQGLAHKLPVVLTQHLDEGGSANL
jgi:hypothetical protein